MRDEFQHMKVLLVMIPEDRIRNPEEVEDLISSEYAINNDSDLRKLMLKGIIHYPVEN